MKRNVLIVDDSEFTRNYHSYILREANFDVVTAVDGADALEKLYSRSFDLVLTDINMANMDGYEFIRRVRSSGDYDNLPIVIISTESEAEDKSRGPRRRKFLHRQALGPQALDRKYLPGSRDRCVAGRPERRPVNPGMEGQESLSVAWVKFEGLSTRLFRYLKTSEEEFGSLIQALDACWNMAENVQKATTRLAELTEAANGSQTAVIRKSLLEGCGVFKNFLIQIQEVRRQLACTAHETGGLLGTSNHLQENIAPLTHIAFHFRLEASRLSPEDSASVLKAYEEMRQVVSFMKQAGDSQERGLLTILDKLSAATRSVDQVSASYAAQATASEESVHHNVDLLLAVSPDLLEVQKKASSLGAVVTDGIREAVKVLQGHDAIRQRLELILGALAKVRQGHGDEPGHELLLQRHQAKSVLEVIVKTGSRIERELNGVIGCAQGIAGDSYTRASGDDQVEKFEKAVDRLASLSTEVAGLLAGEAKMGNFVVTQIDPIRELLSANSHELEVVARSMKRLALNVLIDAEKMPSARGIGVLGAWTSEAAEGVLKLARDQNEQFAQLGATLQSQAAAITADVQEVESCRGVLMAQRANDSLRNSRRIEYDVVTRLCQEGAQLQEKTQALVQSLKFVDEGIELLGELDATIDFLLALYPKSEKPFDLDAASAGYTMQEQHDAHALVSGGEAEDDARPTESTERQDYGANVELF